MLQSTPRVAATEILTDTRRELHRILKGAADKLHADISAKQAVAYAAEDWDGFVAPFWAVECATTPPSPRLVSTRTD